MRWSRRPRSGGDDGGEPLRITHAQLITVIRQRTEQITNEIERGAEGAGFSGPVGRQVVLTGGGAELKNIADYMQGVLGRAVRVGRPRTITGLPEAHSGPAFSTLVGLAMLRRGGSGDIRDLALGGTAEEAGYRHVRPADRRGHEGRVLVVQLAVGASGHPLAASPTGRHWRRRKPAWANGRSPARW